MSRTLYLVLLTCLCIVGILVLWIICGPKIKASIWPPVFGWKTTASQTLVLPPGGRFIGYDVLKGADAPKIQITSKSPVMVGYVSEVYRLPILRKDPNLSPNIFECAQQQALNVTFQCRLNTTEMAHFLYIRDERTPAQAFGVGMLGAMGVRGPLEQEFIRNDVHIEVAYWGCIQNCDNL